MSDNPIVLTLTIYPPKKNQRHVVVTGAPEGEMPLLLEGVFAERHALLDQAFTTVLKRAPQTITLKESKPKTSKPKATAAADEPADDDAEESASKNDPPEAAEESSGNISNEAAADLPAIDGDTAAAEDDEDEPADETTGDEPNEE